MISKRTSYSFNGLLLTTLNVGAYGIRFKMPHTGPFIVSHPSLLSASLWPSDARLVQRSELQLVRSGVLLDSYCTCLPALFGDVLNVKLAHLRKNLCVNRIVLSRAVSNSIQMSSSEKMGNKAQRSYAMEKSPIVGTVDRLQSTVPRSKSKTLKLNSR